MLVRILYKGTHNDPKMLNFPKLIFKIHNTHINKKYTHQKIILVRQPTGNFLFKKV